MVFANKKPNKRTKKTGSNTKTRKNTISGWSLFLKHTISELKKTKFEGKYFAKVSELWNALDDADKQEWKDKASAINTTQAIIALDKVRIQDSGIENANKSDELANQNTKEAVVAVDLGVESNALAEMNNKV